MIREQRAKDTTLLKAFVSEVTLDLIDLISDDGSHPMLIEARLQDAVDQRMPYWRGVLLQTGWTKESAEPIARNFWSDTIYENCTPKSLPRNSCAGVFLYFTKALDSVFESQVN